MVNKITRRALLATGLVSAVAYGRGIFQMEDLHSRLFPELVGRWGELNLDSESRNVSEIDFTDPNEFEKWLKQVHEQKNVNYSYGGFLEDRSNIWRNHYMKDSGDFIHLGVDYNVPAGTSVHLVCDGELVHKMKDTRWGGWGGRLLWKLKDSPFYLAVGHLTDMREASYAGQIAGRVANPNENGYWYPHVHVQLMDRQFVESFSDLDEIDGYIGRNNPNLGYIRNPAIL